MAGNTAAVDHSAQSFDIAGLSHQVDKLMELLKARLPEGEQVSDYDQTWVTYFGTEVAAPPLVIPRTLRHVEITLVSMSIGVGTTGVICLFEGNSIATDPILTQGPAVGVSSALLASAGQKVQGRFWLDRTGLLVLQPIPLSGTELISVLRLRSLDLAARVKQPDDIVGD